MFPAVSALAPGGLGYAEAMDLLTGIGPRLAGAAFTEFVPASDIDERSALTGCRLIGLLAQQATSTRS